MSNLFILISSSKLIFTKSENINDVMNDLGVLLQAASDQELWKDDLVLKRNEILSAEGQTNTDLYFVVSGSLRVFFSDGKEEHTIRFGYQNTFFCALDSFMTETPSIYTIQALKRSKLKVISKTDFMGLVHDSYENQRHWEAILTALVQQQMERELDLLTHLPQDRYARVLKRSPQVFQEIPHKYIAAYLRMTPETLSRIKSLDLNQDSATKKARDLEKN